MDILYTELKDYIYQYCEGFMTEDELSERKAMMYGYVMFSEGGNEGLKERIVTRIWREHRLELNLNLCPVCGKVTRTPYSRQCRFCYYDWHMVEE